MAMEQACIDAKQIVLRDRAPTRKPCGATICNLARKRLQFGSQK